MDKGKSIFKDQLTNRINARSIDLGLSQVDIAKTLGAPKTTVNGWFSGVSMPNGLMLVKLCKVLKCNADWLLGGVGAPFKTSTSSFFDGVIGSWEVDVDAPSPYYRVPKLNYKTGSLDIFDCRLIPSAFIAVDKPDLQLGWIVCSDGASSPAVSTGDVVVIDTKVSTIEKSGAYYAFMYGESVRVHQAFANVDSTLTLQDASRPGHSIVVKMGDVQLLGLVVFRAGSL